MNIKIIKKLSKIKYPKITPCKKFIFGIKPETINNLTKFKIILYNFDEEKLNISLLKEINLNLNSPFIRSIKKYKQNKDLYYLLIENKLDSKLSENETYLYLFDTNNIDIKFIKNLQINNRLVFDYFNLNLTSKIEIDEERPNYYWCKYLFEFKDANNCYYKPKFDNIVDYSKDKGHLIHYIEKKEETNLIIFSIRHKNIQKENDYYYKIYSSYSNDFKHFYDTKNIEIYNNNLTESKWFCYPEIFKSNNKYYVFLNQDDFGKKKDCLFGILNI